MTETRRLKKSESLEIRLPYPTKQAFMARCQADGLTASEALRGFIEGELQPRPRRRRLRYLAAGGLAAAALAAVAAPSIAGPAASAAEFKRLDADHNGQLSLTEFTSAAGRTAHP